MRRAAARDRIRVGLRKGVYRVENYSCGMGTHCDWGGRGSHALEERYVDALLEELLVARRQDGTGADGTELRVRLHTQV